ncbi:unnamed protein product, partial [Allacma fusca]
MTLFESVLFYLTVTLTLLWVYQIWDRKHRRLPAVLIHGYDEIKRVLNQEDFLERFDADWLLHRSFGKRI